MEPEMNLSNLAEAVVHFYASSAEEQARLHSWLSKVQVSPQAWQFCWQLMQLDKVSRSGTRDALKIPASSLSSPPSHNRILSSL